MSEGGGGRWRSRERWEYLFTKQSGVEVEIRHVIPVQGPFRLGTALNVLQRYEAPKRNPARTVRYTASFEVPGGAVEVIVRQEEPGGPLDVRLLGKLVDDTVADLVVGRLIRMFSLGLNPTGFFEKAEEDPHLRLILALYPDLRPVLYPTPFEGAVRTLLALRLPGEEAAQLAANVREVCGIVPADRPHAEPAFPGKWTLLAVSDRLLEVAGVPERKVARIKRLCSALVGEPDLLDHLQTFADPMKARRILETLPGIGRRVAEHLLLRAYGFQDVLFEDDRLFLAVKRFYKLPDIPDVTTVERLAEPFIPWRSWWMFLLTVAHETSVIV